MRIGNLTRSFSLEPAKVVVILVFVKVQIRIHGCDKMKCKLCKEEFEGYGHMLSKGEGKWFCCDACNWTIVLPARLRGVHY